ncbi:hypothetical protein [Planctomicrobium sp. SH527]|uniref:hypothetical protein n=1 Tax=Planctomicrobium sp. SH527 TaxID=3448123 RepID=UPI003F5C9023
MRTSQPLHFMTIASCCMLLVMALLNGCATHRWGSNLTGKKPAPVLTVTSSKPEVIANLNRNLVSTAEHTALKSWRSGAVKLHVEGVPIALPASIAVEAPSNFRLLVSNPLSGGQEVDIGSNHERFWIWSKEMPQVMTSSHDDIALALQELQMPVHIHPLWLMEVFGVMPLNEKDFEIHPANLQSGTIDLVSTQASEFGNDVERIVRVSIQTGCVQEHQLRLPGGKVLARAKMDRYTTLPDGTHLPLSIRLEWPDARMQMTMDIRNPEINSPSLANNTAIWQLPNHGPVVDIGQLARQNSGQLQGMVKGLPASPIAESLSKDAAKAGAIQLVNSTESDDWSLPPGDKKGGSKRPTGMPQVASDTPAWAK